MFSTIFQLSNRPIEKGSISASNTWDRATWSLWTTPARLTTKTAKGKSRTLRGAFCPRACLPSMRTRRWPITGASRSGERLILTLSANGRTHSPRRTSWNGQGLPTTFRKPYSIRSPRTAFSSRSFVTDTERLNGQGNSCGWLKRLQQGKNYISGR